ncbi:MAG TPA: hypothetical protein VGC41_02880, partial [Kofleriaceae bacterium]
MFVNVWEYPIQMLAREIIALRKRLDDLNHPGYAEVSGRLDALESKREGGEPSVREANAELVAVRAQVAGLIRERDAAQTDLAFSRSDAEVAHRA